MSSLTSGLPAFMFMRSNTRSPDHNIILQFPVSARGLAHRYWSLHIQDKHHLATNFPRSMTDVNKKELNEHASLMLVVRLSSRDLGAFPELLLHDWRDKKNLWKPVGAEAKLAARWEIWQWDHDWSWKITHGLPKGQTATSNKHIKQEMEGWYLAELNTCPQSSQTVYNHMYTMCSPELAQAHTAWRCSDVSYKQSHQINRANSLTLSVRF